MTDQALAILLHAIALVETGNRAHVIGRAGERGAFQISPAVAAEVGGYGEREAAKHVRRIVVALEHANAPTDPFHVALAWNAGIGAVQRGRAPVVSYQYAARVRNTFDSLAQGPRHDESRLTLVHRGHPEKRTLPAPVFSLTPDPTAPSIGKTPTRPQLGLQRASAREVGTTQHGTGSGSISLASPMASERRPEPAQARRGIHFATIP